MKSENDKGVELQLTRLGQAVDPGASFVDEIMNRVEQTTMTPSPRAYRVRTWMMRSSMAAAACLLIGMAGWAVYRADNHELARQDDPPTTETLGPLALLPIERLGPGADYAVVEEDPSSTADGKQVEGRDPRYRTFTGTVPTASPEVPSAVDDRMVFDPVATLTGAAARDLQGDDPDMEVLLAGAPSDDQAEGKNVGDVRIHPKPPTQDRVSYGLVAEGFGTRSTLVSGDPVIGDEGRDLYAFGKADCGSTPEKDRFPRVHSGDLVLGQSGYDVLGLPFKPFIVETAGRESIAPHEGEGLTILGKELPYRLLLVVTIAHWRFDRNPVASSASGSDASLADVANGFKCTPFGGPVYRSVDGRVGLDFDGIDDRLFVPDHPSFALTEALTIEAMIRFDGLSAGSPEFNMIVYRGDDREALDPYFLAIGNDERLFFNIGSHEHFVRVVSPEPLERGRWLHVAGTFDGAAKLFIDGKEISSATTTVHPLATLDPSSEPGIGIGSIQSANYPFGFNGMIAEVRISDYARRPNEFLPPVGPTINEHKGQGEKETTVSSLPDGRIWEARWDGVPDGRLEGKVATRLFRFDVANDQLRIRFAGKDKHLNEKHARINHGEIVAGRKPIIIWRRDDMDGYASVSTLHLIRPGCFRGTWEDNLGNAGDIQLTLQAR